MSATYPLIYYCSNCKKIVDSLDQLLFVEEQAHKGFCSDECIEQFYHFLGNFFSKRDRELREILQLKSEQSLDFVGVPRLMEKTLSNPQEIWCIKNQLGEFIYSFIYSEEVERGNTLYSIILCFVYQYRPAYILFSTATYNEAHLFNYRFGTKVEDISPYLSQSEAATSDSLEINQDMIDFFEQKKSSILAEMLQARKDSDIGFEQFTNYLDCHESTLQSPDEIYRMKDEDGDELYIYIKAHARNAISFFYIVICVEGKNRMDGKKTLFPVLGFPTLDPDLCRSFRKGELLKGNLCN